MLKRPTILGVVRDKTRRSPAPVHFYRRAMEHLFVAVVIVVTLRMTSADDDSCEVHPVFNTKERSSDFFAMPAWTEPGGMLHEEESVFVRRRHCPVRVRVDEEATTAPPLGNGKDVSTKKHNSHRKLKGSKRKRRKEKRKRFRKKKKSARHVKKKR